MSANIYLFCKFTYSVFSSSPDLLMLTSRVLLIGLDERKWLTEKNMN